MNHGRQIKLSGGVQDSDFVGDAVIIGVEHDADVVGDGATQIDAGVIERELVELCPAVGIHMLVTALDTGSHSQAGFEGLRPRGRRSKHREAREQNGSAPSKSKSPYGPNTTRPDSQVQIGNSNIGHNQNLFPL
jgi:hypothetical protein